MVFPGDDAFPGAGTFPGEDAGDVPREVFGGPWVVRAVDRDLQPSEDVPYTLIELRENYPDPDMCKIDGRTEDMAPIRFRNAGVVVFDNRGKLRFAGTARQIGSSADGTTTCIFVSYQKIINDAYCWPDPASPWEAQTVVQDAQTGPAETRILNFINRNIGPSAYHANLGSTAAPPGAEFDHLITLTPKNRTWTPQSAAVDEVTGDYYLTQIDGSDSSTGPRDLRISRFVGSVEKSSMTIPDGGHGDQLFIENRADTVFCTFRYGGLSLYRSKAGMWVDLPYTPGKRWRAKDVRKHTSKGPGSSLAGRGATIQGEATYAGNWYRLNGEAYDDAGPVSGAGPATIQLISEEAVVRTVDASTLGRDGSGDPVGGLLEPAGLGIIWILGAPYLLIGISVGTSGHRQMMLYTFPLVYSATAPYDRRHPRLRVPTSLGRGPVDVTKARMSNLGQVVAALSEQANLRVRILPHLVDRVLDVVIDDVPDARAWARFGTPGYGSVDIGDDWNLTISEPEGNVILFAGDGDGTDRMLRQRVNPVSVADWGRVEILLDQPGASDEDKINEALDKATAESGESAEAKATIPADAFDYGTEVPVGTRVTVILDGVYLVDRIRRITTVVERQPVGYIETVTPTFGPPDAGLSPTSKQIRSAMRRRKDLEVKK